MRIINTSKLTKSLTAAAVVFTLGSCVGDDLIRDSGPRVQPEDASLVVAIVNSSTNVQRAMQPIYLCSIKDVSCYRAAAPEILRVVDEEEDRIAGLVGETENACVAQLADLYVSSLDAYREAGRAAVRGDLTAAERAISRSTEYEIAYSKKYLSCGLVDDQRLEITSSLNNAFWDILAISERIFYCKHARCVLENSRRLESKAREGIALVDDYIRDLENPPACLVAALEEFRAALDAIKDMGGAIQRGDVAVAREQGNRAARLGLTAQEDLAACVTELVE